jgi:hypothetical protein
LHEENDMRLVAATTFANIEVVDKHGKNVGSIVDFMLDTQARRVVYGVLAVGGVLGIGTKLLAVPPQALELDSGRRRLMLTVDAAMLDEADAFDRDNPPEQADSALLSEAVRARGDRPPSRP